MTKNPVPNQVPEATTAKEHFVEGMAIAGHSAMEKLDSTRQHVGGVFARAFHKSGDILKGVGHTAGEHKVRTTVALAAGITAGLLVYNVATNHSNVDSAHAVGPNKPTPAEQEYTITNASVDCTQVVEQHDGANQILTQTVNGVSESAVKPKLLSGLNVNPSDTSGNSDRYSDAFTPAFTSADPNTAKEQAIYDACVDPQDEAQLEVETGRVTLGNNGPTIESLNSSWMLADDGSGSSINARTNAVMPEYTFSDAYKQTQYADKEATLISRMDAKEIAVVQPSSTWYHISLESDMTATGIPQAAAETTQNDPYPSLVLLADEKVPVVGCGEQEPALAINVEAGNAFVTNLSTAACETTPSTPGTPAVPTTPGTPTTPHTPNTPSCTPGVDVQCTEKIDKYTSNPGPDPNGTTDLQPAPNTPATPDNGSANPVGGVTSNNSSTSNSGSTSPNSGTGNTSGNTPPPENAGGGTSTNPTTGNVPTPTAGF